MPTAPAASSAIGAGAELCAPLAKLFEATGGAAPLFYSNLVAVLALSLLLGNHHERRKDATKAFTVNEGFEEVFGTMSFMHICKNDADMQSACSKVISGASARSRDRP